MLLSVSLTTVNGPAPTGLILNACSPMVFSAVGEAIQFTFDVESWFLSAPSGAVVITRGRSHTVTDLAGQTGLQVHGEARSRVS